MSSKQILKSVKRNDISFCDLPPRVVIHEILTWKLMKVSFRCRRESHRYFLFGIFKKDRFRNIWFIFPSLNIIPVGFKEVETNMVFIDLRKTYHLDIQNGLHLLLLNAMKNSHRMFTLRSLYFRFDILGFLEKTGCSDIELKFPNLTTFCAPTSTLGIKQFGLQFFKNVRNLSFSRTAYSWNPWDPIIDCSTHQAIHSFFSERTEAKSFENIKKLALRDIKFEKKAVSLFPNLKYVILERICNLQVIPGGEVKVLRVIQVSKDDSIQLIEKSPNLESLVMDTSVESERVWFLDPLVNCLEKLKLLRIGKEYSFDKNSIQHLIRLKNALEVVVMFQESFVKNENVVDVFKDEEYPSLRSVSIRFSGHVDHKKAVLYHWKSSQSIEKLKILYGEDWLFIWNKWPRLEELNCRGWGYEGNHWNKLPFLKKLDLQNLPGFLTNFFRDQRMNGLEELSLVWCPLVGCNGWDQSFFVNLRILKIANCERFRDSFFQDNEFPVLEKLVLEFLNHITGKDWNEFPRIEEICHISCPKIERNSFEDDKKKLEAYINGTTKVKKFFENRLYEDQFDFNQMFSFDDVKIVNE